MVKLLDEIKEKLSNLKTTQEKLNYLNSLLKEIKDESLMKIIKEMIFLIEEEQKQDFFISKAIAKIPEEELKPAPPRIPEDNLENRLAMPTTRETKNTPLNLPSVQERLQRYARELETSKYARPGDVINYALNKELNRRNLSTFDLLANPELRHSFMNEMYNSLGNINPQSARYLSLFDNSLDSLQSEALINAEDTIRYRAKKFESKSYKLKIKEENGI